MRANTRTSNKARRSERDQESIEGHYTRIDFGHESVGWFAGIWLCLARRNCRLGQRRERPESGVVWTAGDASFSEDGRDVARGSDIERRMRGVHVRGNADALEMCDLSRGAFLDGNMLTIG